MGMHFNPHNPQQYQDDPSSAVPGNIYPSMLPNQQAVPHGTGNAPVNSNVPMNANHQTSSCGQPSQPHWTTTGQVANPGAQNPNVIANAYAPMNATQQPIPQAACNLQVNPGLDQRSATLFSISFVHNFCVLMAVKSAHGDRAMKDLMTPPPNPTRLYIYVFCQSALFEKRLYNAG